MARFVTLQQALKAVNDLRSSVVRRRAENLFMHDGFNFNSPAHVQADYERRKAAYVMQDDDFPEFE